MTMFPVIGMSMRHVNAGNGGQAMNWLITLSQQILNILIKCWF